MQCSGDKLYRFLTHIKIFKKNLRTVWFPLRHNIIPTARSWLLKWTVTQAVTSLDRSVYVCHHRAHYFVIHSTLRICCSTIRAQILSLKTNIAHKSHRFFYVVTW